jgi:hypothetical protein
MKIRIKGNSLRYRIVKSDLDKLYKEGLVEERTQFIGKALVYSIESINEGSLSADFTNDKITLRMPKPMIDELYNTERVGFNDKSGLVSILIEKDFVCIDKTDEDQSDNYPNPALKC